MPGQHTDYVSTFWCKMSDFVGKVNYDRPFTDHIGWKKDKSFTEKTHGLVKYDRPYIGYI